MKLDHFYSCGSNMLLYLAALSSQRDFSKAGKHSQIPAVYYPCQHFHMLFFKSVKKNSQLPPHCPPHHPTLPSMLLIIHILRQLPDVCPLFNALDSISNTNSKLQEEIFKFCAEEVSLEAHFP